MNDDLKDNAVLFSLGLLEGSEKERFLAATASNEELQELIREYQTLLGVIALTPEELEPPARLRESILKKAMAGEQSQVDEEPDTRTEPPLRAMPAATSPVEEEDRKIVPMPVSSKIPWLVAAGLAIACGVLFFRVIGLQRENARIVSLENVGNLRTAVLASQVPEMPDISARVAWNPETGTGLLEGISLPPQEEGKTYQLWIFEEGNPAPVSAGLYDPSLNPRVILKPVRPVAEVAAFAVSIEVAGGRPQPEGAVVLVGNISKI